MQVRIFKHVFIPPKTPVLALGNLFFHRPDALWASSWVLKRRGPGPVRSSGEGVRNKNSALMRRLAIFVLCLSQYSKTYQRKHGFPPRPAQIPSDPARIPSHKKHQARARSIFHDRKSKEIAGVPPRLARIPSDPARIPSHKMHQTQAKSIFHDKKSKEIADFSPSPCADPVGSR